MSRVYSEDSAYVDTNPDTNRISFRMSESMPSQDTQLTELRLSSFYSQDYMLGTTPVVDMSKTKTMMTMSSVVSTELDMVARSQDCLVKHSAKEDSKETCPARAKRLSLCCLNYIWDLVTAIISSGTFQQSYH